MTMSKEQKLVIIISIVSSLVVGLFFGFLLGKNADVFQKLFTKEYRYQANCSIYIGKETGSEAISITPDDIELTPYFFSAISNLLETCYPDIKQAFPDVEFDLTLEKIQNTSIFKVLVTGDDPYQVAEICNMAAELLPEKVASTIDGISCKVIERARIPSKPVE